MEEGDIFGELQPDGEQQILPSLSLEKEGESAVSRWRRTIPPVVAQPQQHPERPAEIDCGVVPLLGPAHPAT